MKRARKFRAINALSLSVSSSTSSVHPLYSSILANRRSGPMRIQPFLKGQNHGVIAHISRFDGRRGIPCCLWGCTMLVQREQMCVMRRN